MERVILHCDMNNYYASVECLMNPSLRTKFVAVCGNTAERHGIVLAKNQKAKQKGVKTGDPIWKAKICCPELVVVSPRYELYSHYSHLAREIYYRYTDMIEPFGLDECWLDVTGSVALFGGGEKIAHMIRRTVKKELGLTISVGVSFNKTFAKLGSDMKKPDAVTTIRKTTFREQIWHLSAGDLIGVGKSTKKKLERLGVQTIGDIALMPREILEYHLGKNGGLLWDCANGEDHSRVMHCEDYTPIQSIGHGITTVADLENDKEVWAVLLELSQKVAEKLRKNRLAATGVQLAVRDKLLVDRQFQKKTPYPLQNALLIARQCYKLFKEHYEWSQPVRALSVRAISLQPDEQPIQLNFFSDIAHLEKLEKIDTAVDDIRKRYGSLSVRNAVLLQDLKIPEQSKICALKADTDSPIFT